MWQNKCAPGQNCVKTEQRQKSVKNNSAPGHKPGRVGEVGKVGESGSSGQVQYGPNNNTHNV